MVKSKGKMDAVKEFEGEVPKEDEGIEGTVLMQFLQFKVKGGGQAERIVRGVDLKRGLEAWRKLCQWFERRIDDRGIQAQVDLMIMAGKKAKSAKETKELLVELDERLRRIEECGKISDFEQVKTILVMFMDEETKRHTVKE